MNSKNISVPESVYERLGEEKQDGESFGDVIDRLLGGTELKEFWGRGAMRRRWKHGRRRGPRTKR